MLSFVFIAAVTGICIFVSCSLSSNVTWFDYYTGGVVGLFISGIILHIWNKKRKAREMKERKSLFEKDHIDF